MTDDHDGRNELARRGDAPPIKLARSLQTASRRSFVHVDRSGQVRSPLRFRLLQALDATRMGIVMAAPVFYGWYFGPLGALIALAPSGFLLWRIRAVRRLRRGLAAYADRRFDDAEAAFRSILGRGQAPRDVRALAAQNLGECSAFRGDHQVALDRHREAIRLHGRRRAAMAISVRYAEIRCLVNLGRIEEARACLDQRGPAPAGDYVRYLHWTVELYVCLAEGRHAIDEQALHDRARFALGITTASALLGLLAWAHHHVGELDQAWHLLGEALDRLEDPLDQVMPRLAAWMEQHRAAAEAARAEP